jgi:hypothetical protein
MMLGNPFFSVHDDDEYYYSPYNRGYQKQRRAAKEARQRAEQQRYYRMKELEKQEKLRQRQEYMKRLRQRQQEEAEAEQQRQQRLREVQQQRHHADNEEEEEPVFRLMRGPDGWIYRVQVGKTRKEKSTLKYSDDKENLPDRVSLARPKQQRTTKLANSEAEMEEPQAKPTMMEDTPQLRCRPSKKKKPVHKKGKKRVTVIVEDASDSEAEDDLNNSPWRNRRPSPDEQWMEPVEGFEDFHIR